MKRLFLYLGTLGFFLNACNDDITSHLVEKENQLNSVQVVDGRLKFSSET
jgi:hypothetical protein